MLLPLKKFFGSVSGRDLAFAEPRLEVQVALAGLHAASWFVMTQYIVPPIARKIISGLESKDRFLQLNRESVKNILQYDMGDDPDKQLREVSEIEGILVQHGIGGALCLPSVLGWASRLPPGLASALARQGGLCEVGWEVSDTLQRLYQRTCGGEEGKAKNPNALLAMFAMHHTCAQSMVLPLNLFYPENPYYHEGIFLLQGAAIGAFAIQQYGFTLDITKASELRKMKIASGTCLGIMTWGRIVRYGYVWWKLISQFKEDGNSFVLKLAVPAVTLLSLFNVALMADCILKFAKFYNKSITVDAPEDIQEHAIQALTSPKHLRSSRSFFNLTTSQKQWAKLRGAVHMGVFSNKEKEN